MIFDGPWPIMTTSRENDHLHLDTLIGYKLKGVDKGLSLRNSDVLRSRNRICRNIEEDHTGRFVDQ